MSGECPKGRVRVIGDRGGPYSGGVREAWSEKYNLGDLSPGLGRLLGTAGSGLE